MGADRAAGSGRPSPTTGTSVIYGQRTRDGRIAFGGRGAPYHYASKVSPSYERDERVHTTLRRILVELFPMLRDVEFTHRWGGNLGVPRDWYPAVRHDRCTGLAFAGGYVGDGVATAALAGRTLAAMIRDDDPDDLASLPWAGRTSRLWEPEPLRWLGVNAVTALMGSADRSERRSGRPSRQRPLSGARWASSRNLTRYRSGSRTALSDEGALDEDGHVVAHIHLRCDPHVVAEAPVDQLAPARAGLERGAHPVRDP